MLPGKTGWLRALPQLLLSYILVLWIEHVKPVLYGIGLSWNQFCLLSLLCFLNWRSFLILFEAYPAITIFLGFWIAPLEYIGFLISLAGKFRQQAFQFIPYTYDIIIITPKVLPTILPHLPKLAVNINKLGPLIGKTLHHQEHILPIIEPLLENMDYLIPLSDLLVPHFDKLVPHGHRLLPHFKLLVPHVEAIAAHATALLPFLELEGWEDALPYLEPLARNVDYLAPHAHILQDQEVFDKLRPMIPLFAENIDNVVPIIDELAPKLPEVIGYLDRIPLSLQREYIKSKVACKALPRVVKSIGISKPDVNGNAQNTSRNMSSPVYPMPEQIDFQIRSWEKRVINNQIVIFYRIMFSNDRCREYRYSTLRTLHKRLKFSYESKHSPRMLPEFPKKQPLSGNLSNRFIQGRAMGLQKYLSLLSKMPQILEEPLFTTFVQGFVVTGMIPYEFGQIIESL